HGGARAGAPRARRERPPPGPGAARPARARAAAAPDARSSRRAALDRARAGARAWPARARARAGAAGGGSACGPALSRGGRPRLAVLKPRSAASSLGSAAPCGAAGPIIMTGGAFGSLVAQFFELTAAERKTLLVAGAAAGMSATFASSVAAVLLAVELLLFEWKPRSMIPVALASATAAAARRYLIGLRQLGRRARSAPPDGRRAGRARGHLPPARGHGLLAARQHGRDPRRHHALALHGRRVRRRADARREHAPPSPDRGHPRARHDRARAPPLHPDREGGAARLPPDARVLSRPTRDPLRARGHAAERRRAPRRPAARGADALARGRRAHPGAALPRGRRRAAPPRRGAAGRPAAAPEPARRRGQLPTRGRAAAGGGGCPPRRAAARGRLPDGRDRLHALPGGRARGGTAAGRHGRASRSPRGTRAKPRGRAPARARAPSASGLPLELAPAGRVR